MMTYESVDTNFGVTIMLVLSGLAIFLLVSTTVVAAYWSQKKKKDYSSLGTAVALFGLLTPLLVGGIVYVTAKDNAYQAGVNNIQQKYNVTDVTWSTPSSRGGRTIPSSQEDAAITVTTVNGQKVEVLYRVNDQNEPFLSNMYIRAGDSKSPIIDVESLKK